MFTESAAVHDAIYGSLHDVPAEAQTLRGVIERTKRASGNLLLDVARGTGAYLVPLSRRYAAEGLDLDAAMLAVAREKLPEARLHRADMAAFDLGRRFDAVVCLGSSIGYARTAARLRETLRTLARHLVPGGVVVVEPWFTPEAWRVGRVHGLFVDRPEVKIARMSVSGAEGSVSVFDFQYLIAKPEGIRHAVEHHEMGLFTHDEYLTAFREAGLDATHDPTGPTGRGLYVGVAPRAPG